MKNIIFAAIILCCCINLIGAVKKKKIEFFLHDIVNLGNPGNNTAVIVAGPKNNVSAINTFGSVVIMDDPLTKKRSATSEVVGRAQGYYVYDSRTTVRILFSFTGVLPNGTLSFHGQNANSNPLKEIAVVGGTGVFRHVTGYAKIKTLSGSPSTVLRFRAYYVKTI